MGIKAKQIAMIQNFAIHAEQCKDERANLANLHAKEGLRQRDPLSSILFNLALMVTGHYIHCQAISKLL